MSAGLPNILLISAVAAVATRTDVGTVHGAYPPDLSFIFDGGLEDEYPLLHHTLFGEGERVSFPWCGSGSRIAGYGDREVVQGGLDLRVLLRGGGSELV